MDAIIAMISPFLNGFILGIVFGYGVNLVQEAVEKHKRKQKERNGRLS